jgi:hypothetical protein
MHKSQGRGRGYGRPFQKGRKKTGGRKKGTPNKFSGEVRALVLQALHELGGAEGFKGYVKRIAQEAVIGGGLVRALLPPAPPVQVQIEREQKVYDLDEMRRELESRGIPVGLLWGMNEFKGPLTEHDAAKQRRRREWDDEEGGPPNAG